MVRVMKKLGRDPRGNASVLVSAAIVVLIGFCSLVVDMGNLFLAKHRLGNALDAAVLAGCQELPDDPGGALAVTKEYFAGNGMDSASLLSVDIGSDNKTVVASGQATVQHFLAGLLGIQSSTLSDSAAARIEPLTGVRGVVPLGIKKQDLEFGVKYTLKIASNTNFDEFLGPGTFGVIILDDGGSARYEEYFKYGFDGKVSVGDVFSTDNGNKSGATRDGINYRVSQCTHACTPGDFDPSCPRIIIIPVYEPAEPADPQPGDKIKKVRVVGMAAFLLDIPGDKVVGNESYVDGYFVQMVLEGESDPAGSDFGAYAIRLIQ